MNKCLNGLSTINIELTSLCNKDCWMCGRRKIDRDHPEIAINYGHMDFELVEKIADQLPIGIIIQFHNNGEPLLYPRFGEAVELFSDHIKCTDTNGKLIIEKADEIIDNLDTLTISVIENDEESEEQYKIVKDFLKIKKNRKPYMVYRCLGGVDVKRWEELPGLIAKRILHNPLGSFQYKKEPTIPEIGICMDFLTHPAINREGNLSICVRFDPKRLGVLGNLNEFTIEELWNGKKRREWLKHHVAGQRNKIELCSYCHFWGVPRG